MLKFSADHHFVIGHDHVFQAKPCQDHALSFADDARAVAVVSDGCSSGGETDVGARLLTFATTRAAKVHWEHTPHALPDVSTIGIERALIGDEVRHALGLLPNDLLATSVYACVTEAGALVHLLGDGVIASRMRDGRVEFSRFDWENNMPAYPVYQHDHFAAFICAHGGDPRAPRFLEERWSWSSGLGFTHIGTYPIALSAGIVGVSSHFDAITIDEELDSVAVFTDGVTQIDGVDWKDAVVQLLDFKTTEGAFVKRRMNRMLKDYRKIGHGPSDDIACAVILIEQVSKEGADHDHIEADSEARV